MNSGNNFTIQNHGQQYGQLQNSQNPIYQVFLQPVQNQSQYPLNSPQGQYPLNSPLMFPTIPSLEQIKRNTSIQSMSSDFHSHNTINMGNQQQNFQNYPNNYYQMSSEQNIQQLVKKHDSIGIQSQMQQHQQQQQNHGALIPSTQQISQIKESLSQLLYMQQVIEQQIAYYKSLIQQTNLQIDPHQNINQIQAFNTVINHTKPLLPQTTNNESHNETNCKQAEQPNSFQNKDQSIELNGNNQSALNESIQEKLLKRQKVAEELSDLMHFLIDNMGVLSTDKIFERKKEIKFLSEKEQMIYDQIVNKYQYSKKTKEEMIKFILRKCFKFLKSDMKQYDLTQQKEMDKAFFDKYFDSLDFSCDDQFMPFKQISQLVLQNENKLEKFEEISIKENKKKVTKFVNYILELIDKNKLEKMKSFKRLPWLDSWLKDTHEIAKSLILYEEQSFQQRSSSSQDEKSFSSTKKKQRSEESDFNPICTAKKQEIIKIEMDDTIQRNFQYNSDKAFKSPISQPISHMVAAYHQINPLNLSSVVMSSRQGLSEDNSFQDLH